MTAQTKTQFPMDEAHSCCQTKRASICRTHDCFRKKDHRTDKNVHETTEH
jgi:hypothetical protein